MDPNTFNHDYISVKLLAGLFEASASGPLSVCALILLFMLVAVGRWQKLW